MTTRRENRQEQIRTAYTTLVRTGDKKPWRSCLSRAGDLFVFDIRQLYSYRDRTVFDTSEANATKNKTAVGTKSFIRKIQTSVSRPRDVRGRTRKTYCEHARTPRTTEFGGKRTVRFSRVRRTCGKGLLTARLTRSSNCCYRLPKKNINASRRSPYLPPIPRT